MSRHAYRVGVIDLGSNTVRLIVMQAIPGYSYRLEDQIREVVRLRQGMTSQGLSEAAMARALLTLRLFKRFCDSYGVDVVLSTATSAVREAANGTKFVEKVRREIGLSLRILSGKQEAYYGVLGLLNEVPLSAGYVLDIGGGSAQVSEVREGRFYRGEALTLGALALTERFVTSDPIDDGEYQAIQDEIGRQLDGISWLKKREGYMLAGLGGTIRNLAHMECAKQNFPLDTLLGVNLTHASLMEHIQQLRELPLAKRLKLPGLKSDRADIILPGAMVLQTVMERAALSEITISTHGLREGVFFELFWQHLPYPVIPDVRRFGVLNLARNYNYQKPHANHVRFLARRLFQQLAPLHGYGEAEQDLLDAAALLHDLGTIIGYKGHHKHSQMLIENNGLPGFSPREIALIALLTRYHRKGTPQSSNYALLLSKEDDRLLKQLAALLRLAEYLERGRNAAVDDLMITWNEKELYLTVIADEYPAVEMWDTERKALPLFEDAFKRKIKLNSLTASPAWSLIAPHDSTLLNKY